MQWHRKLIENKYCVYVLDRFWSRQLTNNSYCLIALPSIFTFCFIYVWMITSSLGFVYTWSWLDMCPIFQLFIWLLTLGYWNGLARRRYCVISCCQGLAKLASVGAVFPNTIWSGLLAVEVLCEDCWQPNNCLYNVCFCCFFDVVFHLYFVVLREIVGAVT